MTWKLALVAALPVLEEEAVAAGEGSARKARRVHGHDGDTLQDGQPRLM